VPAWSIGDRLTHRFNSELGIGRVTAVEGRVLVVTFDAGPTMRLAASSDALEPLTEAAPRRDRTLIERLSAGDVDDVPSFLSRLDALQLLAIREAGGLGSMLGGRVRLFPHQLHVAERATARMPVRWLLADEVGLGKTIEAALIMNRLLHTQRIERCLVVAPEALTVQWLGELWRKYHQVFTLLDAPRLADVARDFGDGFNPFDVHRRAVIALETLVDRPDLAAKAVDAGIDLLVVDEAQHLRRPPGHPGEPGYRAVAPIAALGRHVLLLSATPLEDDAHGFFRLLQLLRPEEFPEGLDIQARLDSGEPFPPCTSSTRRVDIGGLPPRVPTPVDIDASSEALALRAAEPVARGIHTLGLARPARTDIEKVGPAVPARPPGPSPSAPAANPVTARRTVERIRRALASGAALKAVLGPDERELREQADAADRNDPRLAWLATQAARWRDAGEKTLVFVAHRETLDMLRDALSARVMLATGLFHEDLSAARRDTEVARFRADDGPSLLVSTEAGGEGRNFEFCHRLVLYDLPWKPAAVEQRIGRLDRIGRRIPVEVVYFRPASGLGADVVRLFERLGLFREPMAGVEPQLALVERALEDLALTPGATLSDTAIDDLLAAAEAARTRIHDAAYQQMHRDPYHADLASSVLSRVPDDLDERMERVIVDRAARLGFRVEHVRGPRAYAVEFGSEALVDSLPGVSAGATFVGSFDREYAVQDESRDFFSSGHALVEGLLAHLDESTDGRVTRLDLRLPGDAGAGLVAIYKDGSAWDVVALDVEGRPRPTWVGALRSPIGRLRVTAADPGHDWARLIGRVAKRLPTDRAPHAVAALLVRP